MKNRTHKLVANSLVVNPFVSEAQRRWMYSQHPEMAKEWESHTPKGTKLPRKKGKSKFSTNAANPLRIDPTRTITLRRQFAITLRKQFARLSAQVYHLIAVEDALGLATTPIHNVSSAPPLQISVPVVLQSKSYSCGAACLAAVCRYWSIGPETESSALAVLDTDQSSGTSPTSIAEAAERAGLNATVRSGMSIGDLSLLFDQGIPIICAIQAHGSSTEESQGDSGHYVVVIGISADSSISLMDPAIGNTTMLLADFEKAWWDKGDSDDTVWDRLGIAISGPLSLSTNEFDESKHLRDADGKFVSFGAAEHAAKLYIKDKIGAGVAKLPPEWQSVAKASYSVAAAVTKVAFGTWAASSLLAEKVAKERGLSDEDARRLRGTLAGWDMLAFKPIEVGLHIAGLSAATLAKGSMIPPITASYLLYSTAKNPLATYRAAKGIVKDFLSRRIPDSTPLKGRDLSGKLLATNISHDDASLLADALSAYSYSDWYIALLHAVLGESRNRLSLIEAISIASKAYATFSQDNSEPMEDDVENVLGSTNPPILISNTRWQFSTSPQKLEAFQHWLRSQISQEITGATNEELWHRYIQAGWHKGAARAFDDTKRSRRMRSLATTDQALDFYAGTKDQFLRSSFNQPVAIEKVKLLASRAFEDLEGITNDMSTRMSHVLVDGLVQGKHPRHIAKDLVDQVGLGRKRSEMISRTELVRSHSEGQLEALESLGVEEVGVAVEWSTADDGTVCPACEALQGIVLKISEAHGMIPRHPNCFANPDTFVATEVGWMPLKMVEIGCHVLTHKNRFRKVTQVHRTQAPMHTLLVSLVTGTDELFYPLEVTVSHPILISDSKWLTAGQVEVGELLKLSKIDDSGNLSTSAQVKEIRHRRLYGDTLYNLSVEEDESYVVAWYKGQGIARSQGGYIVHNCKCSFLPAGVGEDDSDQKTTKQAIDQAIAFSQEATTSKKTGEDVSGWAQDTEIASRRPQSILNADYGSVLDELSRFVVENSFCPTGEGGGVDPTCSPSSSMFGDSERLQREYIHYTAGQGHVSLKLDYRPWVNNLSKEEVAGIRRYSTEGFKRINPKLRSGAPQTALDQKAIEACDSALARAEVQESFVAYRGLKATKGFDPRSLIGKTFKDAGFGSVTMKSSLAKSFSKSEEDAVLIEVHIPKGTKGGYIPSVSKHPLEEEFLLPRDTTYRVVAYRHSQDEYGIMQKFLQVEIVND